MPRYTVDVKAFFSIEVEAPNAAQARCAADAAIEDLMVADENTLAGYNEGRETGSHIVPQQIHPAIDGVSDVDPA